MSVRKNFHLVCRKELLCVGELRLLERLSHQNPPPYVWLFQYKYYACCADHCDAIVDTIGLICVQTAALTVTSLRRVCASASTTAACTGTRARVTTSSAALHPTSLYVRRAGRSCTTAPISRSARSQPTCSVTSNRLMVWLTSYEWRYFSVNEFSDGMELEILLIY